MPLWASFYGYPAVGISPERSGCVRYAISNLIDGGNGSSSSTRKTGVPGRGFSLRDLMERAGLPKNLCLRALIDHEPRPFWLLKKRSGRGVTPDEVAIPLMAVNRGAGKRREQRKSPCSNLDRTTLTSFWTGMRYRCSR